MCGSSICWRKKSTVVDKRTDAMLRPKLDLALSSTCCDTLLRQYDIKMTPFICHIVNPNDQHRPRIDRIRVPSTEYPNTGRRLA
eukprot:scaffold353082_cov35-Attheya_sp.AAC.1